MTSATSPSELPFERTSTEGLSLAKLMQVSATADPQRFIGLPETYGALGIYGGHLLGQALSAGFMGLGESKLAQSFHAYFVNRGDPDQILEYYVQPLREGRGSEIKNITVRQGDTTVLHMTAAFKRPEQGDEHQGQAPAVTSAESLIAAREAKGTPAFPFPIIQGGRAEVEFASDSFLEFNPDQDPALQIWMRITGEEVLDEQSKQVVLAYLSDATLMFNSVLPHGMPMQTHRLTSLDHNVWFHRPTDPAQWVLFDQRSSAAADGRGMNHGEIYDAQGQLIMTCAQESMLRRI